ncbi:MAG TPA: glycoside hydrolase family 18 protein, partial [Verrucomicrobiae bacterium]|nr:glycoside hydrolase family 18 protein [Verrucomicrobiae bacterium]
MISPSAIILALALSSFLAPLAFGQGGTSEEQKPEKVFVAYVYRPPRNLNFSLYTHLCHAFITADENGIVRTNANVPSRTLVADAHKNGVKVLLSLGGWGWDKQFASIVSQPEAEDRYVHSVLSLVDTFEYDGIDLDWEYPDTRKEVEGFRRLFGAFRAELTAIGVKKNRKMLQTMAASATPPTLEWLPNNVLLEKLDWINVMTYDMAGEWTDYAGHHAPLFASSKQPGASRSCELSIKYLLQKGIPADHLALGIPLYGKGFLVSDPYASTRDKKNAGRPPGGSYTKLVELQKDNGWIRQWNNETMTPWLLAPDHSAVIG